MNGYAIECRINAEDTFLTLRHQRVLFQTLQFLQDQVLDVTHICILDVLYLHFMIL